MSNFAEYRDSELVDAKDRKRRKRADRFRRSVEALIRSNRSLIVFGPDMAVDGLAEECGLDPGVDYCQFEVKQDGRQFCLLFVPQGYWHRADRMAKFRELKAGASMLGHHVVLVPEALVRRAVHVARFEEDMPELDLEVSGSDRMAVISFLARTGGGTLAEVAGLLDHPYPVPAVLRLATLGAVHIDLDAAILPASEVSFPVQVH
nr:hypothetical protein [uncultured Devosia sp.]